LKFEMAKNSLFAILLRAPWWISVGVALALGLASLALLPAQFRAVGAISALPFAVIAALAARRQWRLPSAARVAEVHHALATMAWQEFAALLEQSFRRGGHLVQHGKGTVVDFELERQGRRMFVCARRWKSARIGVESLRTLQAAREAGAAPDALYIGLGSLTDGARLFATENRIAVWQAAELAHALRGVPLATTRPGTTHVESQRCAP
jgi:restriction system protein